MNPRQFDIDFHDPDHEFPPDERLEIIEVLRLQEDLYHKLNTAFANTQYPGDEEILKGYRWGGGDVLPVNILGMDWREVTPEMFVTEGVSILIFHKKAFQYYLPAILIACMLRDLESEIGDIFIPPFCASSGDRYSNDWSMFKDRFEGLTSEQQACIALYIDMCKADLNDYECARSYWANPYFPTEEVPFEWRKT